MKKIIILLSIFYLAGFSVSGQENNLYYEIQEAKKMGISFENAFINRENTDVRVLSNFINSEEVSFFGAISLDLRNNNIKAMNLTIPTNNKNIVLELVEVPESFYDYEILIMPDSIKTTANRDIKHYRGVVRGETNSLVAITFYEDDIMGLVCTNEGNFNIVKDRISGTHIFYNDKNLIETEYPVCCTKDDFSSSYVPEVLLEQRSNIDINDLGINTRMIYKKVRFFAETRNNMHKELGSINAVNVFVAALFNQVSALYFNEDIWASLSYICVWSSGDPYTTRNVEKLLKQFQNKTDSFDGDLGILLSFKGTKGGLAAGNKGLCNSSVKEKLAVANIRNSYEIVPNYSRSVKTVTHELGHLFGSYHTHACQWNGNWTPIDGCEEPEGGGFQCRQGHIPPEGGTIMSYCDLYSGGPGVNFNLGFGPQPGNLIRKNVKEASCLQCSTPETISDQTITTNRNIIGCETLTLQNITISNDATVNIMAEEKVMLKPNFHAAVGTNVHIMVGNSSKGNESPQSSMFLTKYETTSEETNSQNLVTNNINSPTFTLYPNPNPGTFQLETNFPFSAIGNLKITNLLGATVYETQNVASNMVQLQNPAAGTFFVVMVLKDGAVLTRKMVIQK